MGAVGAGFPLVFPLEETGAEESTYWIVVAETEAESICLV